MLTITAVKSAILEILSDEPMSSSEVHYSLTIEMHPNISKRDSDHALAKLVESGNVQTHIYQDPDSEDLYTLYYKSESE